MCEISGRRGRGMVMILVLVLVALLLIVTLAIIAGSNSASQSTTAVSIKYRVLNAAEGGENVALNAVATNPGTQEGTQLNGSLNGIAYQAWIRANNLLGATPETWTDPATGNSITIPPNSAYLYGTASDNGGHPVFVEAIAEPVPPLTLPPGVFNAGGNVVDMTASPINADALNPNDADIYALKDILVSSPVESPVQGNTYAGGTDNLDGMNGRHSDASFTFQFPSAAQVNEAARTAKLSAQTGSQIAPATIEQGGTFKGNVYVNGNVTLNQPVIFTSGTFVYIDGDLCVGSAGSMSNTNAGKSEFVVNGTVEVSGGGTYAATAGQNALMLVLGFDQASSSAGTPCDAANAHAIDLEVGASGENAVGTLYAPNGSIELTGAGTLLGAVDAGNDLLFNSSNVKAGMQYDAAQAQTTLNTGTLTYNSYIEY